MQLKHLIVALSMVPLTVFGQQVWSLEKCIKYAKDNNIQIKQSELQVEMAKRLKLQSMARFLPTVNVQGNYNANYGRNIDPFTNEPVTTGIRTTQAFLSGSMNLFSGLQNWSLLAQSHYDLLASVKDTEQRSNDVSLSIATAYLQILAAKEFLKNAQNQLEITKLQKDRITTLFNAGQLAESNKYDIEAQFARDELAKVNAENNLNFYYLQLYQYLQLDIGTEIEVETPGNIPVDGVLLGTSADEVYKSALGIMPEVEAQELRMKSSLKALNSAYGGLSPRLSFNANYGSVYSSNNTSVQLSGGQYTPFTVYDANNMPITTYYTFQPTFSRGEVIPFNEQFKNNVSKAYGITLTIPLFNGLQANTAVKRAQVNSMNAKLQYDAVKNTLQQSVQRAYNDALSAYKSYFAAEKLVTATRESFKYAEIKYQQNLINLVEYSDMKIKFSNAENDLVRAKYDYVFKAKVIDFYQGKGLSLN